MTSTLDTLLRLPATSRRGSAGALPSGAEPTGAAPLCSQAASALLTRVAPLLPNQPGTVPSLHMLACGVGAHAQRIMYDIGCASAQLLGRTLLINDAMPDWPAAGLAPPAAALPDIDVPDLYHLAMTPPLYKAMLLRGADFMAGLAPDRAPFQMVLVGSSASAFSGGLSVLAPLCGGCIMLVGAGCARIAEVREAMALVAASGGRVLGTVLVQGSKDVLF